MNPESVVRALLILCGGFLVLAVVTYVVLASVLHTAWEVTASGLTLRSAAMLGLPVRIGWAAVAAITFDSKMVYRTNLQCMNLDGRILTSRHVTLLRRGERAIQFTPRDLHAFARQLDAVLVGRPGWSRDAGGWQRIVDSTGMAANANPSRRAGARRAPKGFEDSKLT